MLKLSKAFLEENYIYKQLNPYEIADLVGCNHKTVRRYLRLHNIKLRTASEYNYLPRVSHIKPSKEELLGKKSVAAHVAYLCEGWHTDKTNMFYFCNTDPLLCDLIIWCLNTVYKVKSIRLVILTNSIDEAWHLTNLYPEAKISIEASRKTPILRVLSGGKTLARDFIKNAYDILTWID